MKKEISDTFQKNFFFSKTDLQILLKFEIFQKLFLTLSGNAEWEDFTVPFFQKKTIYVDFKAQGNFLISLPW